MLALWVQNASMQQCKSQLPPQVAVQTWQARGGAISAEAWATLHQHARASWHGLEKDSDEPLVMISPGELGQLYLWEALGE